MHAGKPLHLLPQRRLRRPWCAPQRTLEGAPQVRERKLRLACAALAGQRREIALAVQRHRDAEQPLDHALVDLPRQIDPLLELHRLLGLGRDDPRHRRQRRRLAQRPEQVLLGVIKRRCRHQPVGEDHADRAAGRGHRHAEQAYRLLEIGLVLDGELPADVARYFDDGVSAERARRDRCRLDRHVRADERREVEPVRAGRPHPPASRVVAEDHRAPHSRQPADRLAQTGVEIVARSAPDPAARAPRQTARAPRR